MAMTGAERQKNYRLRLRQNLIRKLGGKCVDCKSIVDLEFDHTEPREWKSAEVWSAKRIRIYAEEADQGKIVLRCRVCNARKGQPVAATDEEEF